MMYVTYGTPGTLCTMCAICTEYHYICAVYAIVISMYLIFHISLYCVTSLMKKQSVFRMFFINWQYTSLDLAT